MKFWKKITFSYPHTLSSNGQWCLFGACLKNEPIEIEIDKLAYESARSDA